MKQQRLTATLIVLAVLTIGACNRQEWTAPETQTTTGLQPRMEPMTVAGCLRAGAAERTFVLTTEGSTDTGAAITYQLTGANGVELSDHVGQQVEVSGTLRAEQQMTSSGESVDKDRAEGTAGTPVVETKSEIGIRQLDVSSVKPMGTRCVD